MGVPAETLPYSADDATLIRRVRRGDDSSYAELYERYSPMAHRYASSRLVNRTDAADVVSEVFSSVLAAVKNGRGPVGSFAPYLMTSLRNECQRVNRRLALERVTSEGDGEESSVASEVDPFVALDEVAVIRDAFESLPRRFRDVLWRLEVVDEPNGQVARRYRTTPQAISMLAMRARRALGSAYLTRHLAAEATVHEIDPACRRVRPLLADVVRKTASPLQQQQVGRHLIECETCRRAGEELARMNEHLRAMPIAPAGALAALGVASSAVGGAIKAQVAAWWTFVTPAAATSGLAAFSLLSPVLLSQDTGLREPGWVGSVAHMAGAPETGLAPAGGSVGGPATPADGADGVLGYPAISPSDDRPRPTGDAATVAVVAHTVTGVDIDAAPRRGDGSGSAQAEHGGRDGLPSSAGNPGEPRTVADTSPPPRAADPTLPPQAANAAPPRQGASGSPPPQAANPVLPPQAAHASPPPFAASPPAATSNGGDGREDDVGDAGNQARGNPDRDSGGGHDRATAEDAEGD